MLKDKLKEFNLDSENIVFYGDNKAKINLKENNKKGKLVLVTSINPTPFGEGKTTVSIGLVDALCKLGKKAILSLREPSLGPVFGKKGGACGGGNSIIEPANDINLHFNGDIHAITSANNLISAAIDNHLYWGNELNIDISTIAFRRCIDINDRALRNIEIKIDKNISRLEHFELTAASELMAILCLSKDFSDLYERVSEIYIANDINGKAIYVKDLKCTDAVCVLLKDAIKPNLVLTKEGNLALIHGGPFANIAHGTSSFIATKTALNLADIVVTEAGFGSDLGGIKYFDIVSRLGLMPDLVVLNVSIRSLKYNGYDNLEKGISNLDFHLENMSFFSSNIIVVLNQFEDDDIVDINYIKEYVENKGYNFSISNSYMNGSNGGIDFAKKVIELLKCENKINYLYDLKEKLEEKINKVLNHLGASNIIFSDKAVDKIKTMNDISYPICIAKTPMSISDDDKKLGFPKNYEVTVKDIKLCNGAKFIVVYLGNILTLPGLGNDANLYKIKIDNFY